MEIDSKSLGKYKNLVCKHKIGLAIENNLKLKGFGLKKISKKSGRPGKAKPDLVKEEVQTNHQNYH